MIGWHKLLGISFVDYFTDTPYSVDIEKELEIPQYLDYIILENTEVDNQLIDPPDGFESLNKYNLITYKSSQESLNGWALNELISYYVLYRKILSALAEKKDKKKLVPPELFKLFAVSTRFPVKLLKNERYKELKEGIFQIKQGDQYVDIIVVSKLPKTKNNAFWHLFGLDQESIEFGFNNYQWNREDIKYYIFNELSKLKGGKHMSYTVDDFKREVVRKNKHLFTWNDFVKY
ncbi:hypothetical protein MHK_007339, partial [Candidatus Magnetomorum sp. HK-1]